VPGVYGLSNDLLDTPWPKVASTKTGFHALLNGGASDPTADLFALLSDRNRPADDLLPSTGVGPDWERLLSSAFVASDDYGTRSSTVVLAGRDAGIIFIEHTPSVAGVSPAQKHAASSAQTSTSGYRSGSQIRTILACSTQVMEFSGILGYSTEEKVYTYYGIDNSNMTIGERPSGHCAGGYLDLHR
jgi:hypothetical protein